MAQARASRQIAQTLFATARAAEPPLHDVYPKLGIDPRARLEAALDDASCGAANGLRQRDRSGREPVHRAPCVAFDMANRPGPVGSGAALAVALAVGSTIAVPLWRTRAEERPAATAAE